MLLQNTRIGKTAVLIIILILLGLLAIMPLFLQADTTGETEASLFLPIVYNQTDSTATPTTTASPTIHPTITASSTSTATSTYTPLPRCDIQFEGSVFAGDSEVQVTGDVGTEVTIINLSDGETVLGSGILEGPVEGHACDGFAAISISPVLESSNIGDILLAVDLANLENNDTIIVTGVPTPTATPTSTPVEPYIVAVPDCFPGPDIEFNLQGGNFPTDEILVLSWEGSPQIVFQANQHSGSFNMNWTFMGLSEGIYTVSAISGSTNITVEEQIYIPCGITPTPQPADLIVGQPQLISTPPVVVYQPLTFEVPITNTGDLPVETLFFVDLLFDPTPVHFVDSYTAVSGLGGGSTTTLTITSTIGLANFLGDHQVTALVDSLNHVSEADKTNNLSAPFEITVTEPAMTPVSTSTPNGSETVAGITQILEDSLLPIERAQVTLIDETSGLLIASTYSDENGVYTLNNIPTGTTYTVQACITIDNQPFFGLRTGIEAPNLTTLVALLPQPCP
ncbi:carboxypeptidase-like regulatory domain-containing protein [Candidatus Leptofilum sp.]|uniref:carboxypeptidase-like regulatory domain-containing protein n=1 Tax=Candidatus Leptofilum sp. TaxID=3241576 RepID=UPI003B5CC784